MTRYDYQYYLAKAKKYKQKYLQLCQEAGAKECTPDQIRNPESGRCVKRTGRIGRKILATRASSSPTHPHPSPEPTPAPAPAPTPAPATTSKSKPKSTPPTTQSLPALPRNCAARHGHDRTSCLADIDPETEENNCLWDDMLLEYEQPIWQQTDLLTKLEEDLTTASSKTRLRKQIATERKKLAKLQANLKAAQDRGEGSCTANYMKEEDDYSRLVIDPGISDPFLGEVLAYYGEYKDLDQLTEIWNKDINGLRTRTKQEYGDDIELYHK